MLDLKLPRWGQVVGWASRARGTARAIARPQPECRAWALLLRQGWARAEDDFRASLRKNLSSFWRPVDLRVSKILTVELSELHWPKSLLRTAGPFLSLSPTDCCRSRREGAAQQAIHPTGWSHVLGPCGAAEPLFFTASSSFWIWQCRFSFLHCSYSLYVSQLSKATNNRYFHLNWWYFRSAEVNQVLIELASVCIHKAMAEEKRFILHFKARFWSRRGPSFKGHFFKLFSYL